MRVMARSVGTGVLLLARLVGMAVRGKESGAVAEMFGGIDSDN
jgi:hypothetical protein